MASLLKFSSILFFILLSFESMACSCAAIHNFCDLFSESESSILLLEIEKDSSYGNINNYNLPQYYDAKIVETLFGPELEIDSITFMSRFPDCEFSMSLDIRDTIIIKISTLEPDSNAHYPTTYMLTPCLNNFLQIEHSKVFGNFNYVRYSSQHLDTMSFEQFLDWYPNCSAIINTNDIEEFSEIKIFPNPVVDILNVKNNSDKQITYSLFNLNGILVGNGTTSARSQTEIVNIALPSGVYYLRLEDGIRQKIEKILKL
ncbi:T9SS type A sorting domain-containing protein [Portibacter lacus]|nr:T9SS type A sorting domain-containing protein [Portibacter lacus]